MESDAVDTPRCEVCRLGMLPIGERTGRTVWYCPEDSVFSLAD
jgi:hypothetical protein